MATEVRGGGASRNRNQLFYGGVGVAVTRYVQQMLSVVKGMKALLLDRHTKAIISGVLSQTECCALDAVLIQDITNKQMRDIPRDLGHLEAVVFMRPCNESLEAIRKQLSDPRFKKYHLFFTNIIQSGYLSEIAHVDKHEVVATVQEYYADFLPVNADLFHFGIPHSVGLHSPNPTRVQTLTYDRTVASLAAVLLALKSRPVIRFARHSQVCRNLANDLKTTIRENVDGSFGWDQPARPPMLLILDRRDDPITPLLTQWTYQAMVHEVLGIDNSCVNLKDIVVDCPKDFQMCVLNPFDDEFYGNMMMRNWGEITECLNAEFKKFQTKVKSTKSISSIQDMQKFVTDYPAFAQEQTHVSKHMTVTGAVTEQITNRKLYELSEVEQNIVAQYNPKDDYDKVLNIMSDQQIPFDDKLRLFAIYVLRYEDASRASTLPKLRNIMRDLAKDQEQHGKARIVDTLLRYCGEGHRGGQPLFDPKQKSLLGRLSGGFGGSEADNVYLQHKTLLEATLDLAEAGKLSSGEYPFVDRTEETARPPQDLIVFQFGGTTYEEARHVHARNQRAAGDGMRIILGGSYIHNSKTFLDDVARNWDAATDHVSLSVGNRV